MSLWIIIRETIKQILLIGLKDKINKELQRHEKKTQNES